MISLLFWVKFSASGSNILCELYQWFSHSSGKKTLIIIWIFTSYPCFSFPVSNGALQKWHQIVIKVSTHYLNKSPFPKSDWLNLNPQFNEWECLEREKIEKSHQKIKNLFKYFLQIFHGWTGNSAPNHSLDVFKLIFKQDP